MIEQLAAAEARLGQINERLMDPAVVEDQAQYKALMREFKSLSPIIEKYREYKAAQACVDEAKELLSTPLDPDFKELAVNAAKGRERIEVDREKAREKYDGDLGGFADAKPQDQKRNHRQRRRHPQALEHDVRGLFGARRP